MCALNGFGAPFIPLYFSMFSMYCLYECYEFLCGMQCPRNPQCLGTPFNLFVVPLVSNKTFLLSLSRCFGRNDSGTFSHFGAPFVSMHPFPNVVVQVVPP